MGTVKGVFTTRWRDESDYKRAWALYAQWSRISGAGHSEWDKAMLVKDGVLLSITDIRGIDMTFNAGPVAA